MGVPGPQVKGRFEGRTYMQLQIVAKPSVLCCHLANTNEELGGLATAIPPFAKLLWSLLKYDGTMLSLGSFMSTFLGSSDIKLYHFILPN